MQPLSLLLAVLTLAFADDSDVMDCGKCVKEFDAAGGCETMMRTTTCDHWIYCETATFYKWKLAIQGGCDHCVMDALIYCNVKPVDMLPKDEKPVDTTPEDEKPGTLYWRNFFSGDEYEFIGDGYCLDYRASVPIFYAKKGLSLEDCKQQCSEMEQCYQLWFVQHVGNSCLLFPKGGDLGKTWNGWTWDKNLPPDAFTRSKYGTISGCRPHRMIFPKSGYQLFRKKERCGGKDDGCTKIQEGDGDCDYDGECAGDLRCGKDNCVGSEFDPTDDCCYKPDVEEEDCVDDPTWTSSWRSSLTCATIGDSWKGYCEHHIYKKGKVGVDEVTILEACRKSCYVCGVKPTPRPTSGEETKPFKECIAEALDEEKRALWDEKTEAHCCDQIAFAKGNSTPYDCPSVCAAMSRPHQCRNAGFDAQGRWCEWSGGNSIGHCRARECSIFKQEWKCRGRKMYGEICYWKNDKCGTESNADVPCNTYTNRGSCLKTGKAAECMWEKKGTKKRHRRPSRCYGPNDPEHQITCSRWKNPKKCTPEKGCRWVLDSCTDA